jgi:hypothetical protein
MLPKRRVVSIPAALLSLALAVGATKAWAGFTGSDVFIAASARSAGVGASEFYSTLWITNFGSATANIKLDFLRQGQANPTPVTRTDTLAPGATRRYENFVEQLFGISGAGAVHVRADQEIFVSSRTYDRPPGTELKDIKGLFFSAIPASFAIGLGEVARLQGVTNGPLEDFRYNFGLVEVSGQAVTVAVRLKGENGAVTNTQQYDLGAFEARQVNAFAGFSPVVSTTDALLEAQIVGGAGKVLFYGTQIANGSQDSSGFEMSFRSSLLTSSGGTLTGVLAGAGLIGGGTSGTVTIGIANNGIVNPMLQDGSVTGAKIASGQTVRSLNGLTDNVSLQAGANISISAAGSVMTISSPGGGGFSLPFSGNVSTGPAAAFSINNQLSGAVSAKTGAQGDAIYAEGYVALHAVGPVDQSTGIIAEHSPTGNGATLAAKYCGVCGVIYNSGGMAVSGHAVGDGIGVYGYSDRGFAVHGLSPRNYGVYGVSDYSYGVAASSSFSYAVAAQSANSTAVLGESTSNVGVKGQAVGTSGVNYGVYGSTSSPSGYAGWFDGSVRVNGTLSKSGGSFKIDHPQDPAGKYLSHSFVESPDMKNVYDGIVVLDAVGQAAVQLPTWFEALNGDYRYQLTCVGGFAPVYISQEITNGYFRIAGGRAGVKVSWQVTGIRRDAWAQAHRIPVEEEKAPEERGRFLHPELFGAGPELRVDYKAVAAEVERQREGRPLVRAERAHQ